MSAEMFVLWLRGYFDIHHATGNNSPRGMTAAQVQLMHTRLLEVKLANGEQLPPPPAPAAVDPATGGATSA